MTTFNIGDRVRLTGEAWVKHLPGVTEATIEGVDHSAPFGKPGPDPYFLHDGECWYVDAEGDWAAVLVEPEPEPEPVPTNQFKVGDRVRLTGKDWEPLGMLGFIVTVTVTGSSEQSGPEFEFGGSPYSIYHKHWAVVKNGVTRVDRIVDYSAELVEESAPHPAQGNLPELIKAARAHVRRDKYGFVETDDATEAGRAILALLDALDPEGGNA